MYFELNNLIFRQVVDSVIPLGCDIVWTFSKKSLVLSGRNTTTAVWVTMNSVLFEKYLLPEEPIRRMVNIRNLMAVLSHFDVNSTIIVDLNHAQKFTVRSKNGLHENEFVFPTADTTTFEELSEFVPNKTDECIVGAPTFRRLCTNLSKFGNIAQFQFAPDTLVGFVDSPEAAISISITSRSFLGQARKVSYNLKDVLSCLRFADHVNTLNIMVAENNLTIFRFDVDNPLHRSSSICRVEFLQTPLIE